MGYFLDDRSPYEITAGEESEVWADQSDLKKKVKEIVDSTKYNRRSLVLAWGYFGAGKTHKLHQIKRMVEKQNAGICILAPLAQAPKNFAELIKTLFFDHVWDQFLDKFVKEFVKGDNSSEEIKTKIQRVTKSNPDLSRAFVKLMHVIKGQGSDSTEVIQISQWMRGEKLNKFTREWFGRQLKEDRDFVNLAESIIRTLLLKDKDGVSKPVFWIVDDCHFLSDLGEKKLHAVYKGFKDIFDLSTGKFVLILSYAAGTADSIEILPDLKSRVTTTLAVLPLKKQTALTYIKELHSHHSYAKNPDQTNRFYPLDEESAQTLINKIEETRGLRLLPRTINKFLNYIVGKCSDEGLRKIKSEDVIKKFNQYKSTLMAEEDID